MSQINPKFIDDIQIILLLSCLVGLHVTVCQLFLCSLIISKCPYYEKLILTIVNVQIEKCVRIQFYRCDLDKSLSGCQMLF